MITHEKVHFKKYEKYFVNIYGIVVKFNMGLTATSGTGGSIVLQAGTGAQLIIGMSEEDFVSTMIRRLCETAVQDLARSKLSLEEIFERIRTARFEYETKEVIER